MNAVKGHQRAQRLFTELLATTERERLRSQAEWIDGALTYKLAWDKELERRRVHGIVAPEPIPHPDHIKIDFRTGAVQILGPMTKEEKADLEVWREYKHTFEAELEELEQLLVDGTDDMRPDEIEEEIRTHGLAIQVIEKMLRTGQSLFSPERLDVG